MANEKNKKSTGGEALPEKEIKNDGTQELKAEVVDPFKGMDRKEKGIVISEMAVDMLVNSNKVLKEQKEHLRLFDERHPVMDAIKKNETVLGYIEDFKKELDA